MESPRKEWTKLFIEINMSLEDKRFLVIGESCLDVFWYGPVPRLAPEAPAPVFIPTTRTQNPGMAMNVQKNIEALGGNCDLVTNPNWEDIHKTRFIHDNTNQMLMRVDVNDNTVGRCNVKSINLLDYDAVVISDYCKGFLEEDDILHIGMTHPNVFLDTKKKLGSWCQDVSFIKINNYEFEQSKGLLDDRLVDKLIVTLGRKGCLYQGKTYPVESVDIKDVSGAGDTFLSGFVVKYTTTGNIDKSLEYANECATVVVQKKGVSTVS